MSLYLAGSGVVEVELNYGGGEGDDGVSVGTDFPFTFDVELNYSLRIEQVNSIQVDTSSFSG
jgi:hypothetical protein